MGENSITVSVLLTGEDGSLLRLDAPPVCQLSLALRRAQICHCSAISASGCWLAYSDHKSTRLFQLSQTIAV